VILLQDQLINVAQGKSLSAARITWSTGLKKAKTQSYLILPLGTTEVIYLQDAV
jgi:hypothetical protein